MKLLTLCDAGLWKSFLLNKTRLGFDGWMVSVIGAYLASCGGATAFLHIMYRFAKNLVRQAFLDRQTSTWTAGLLLAMSRLPFVLRRSAIPAQL